MGRYYTMKSGKYDGKFWVGTQSSADPETFGMDEIGHRPDEQIIEYATNNADVVREELDKQFTKLGVPSEERRYRFDNSTEVYDYVWDKLGKYFLTDKPPKEGAIGWYAGEGKPTMYGISKELEETAARVDLGLNILNEMYANNGVCVLDAEY